MSVIHESRPLGLDCNLRVERVRSNQSETRDPEDDNPPEPNEPDDKTFAPSQHDHAARLFEVVVIVCIIMLYICCTWLLP